MSLNKEIEKLLNKINEECRRYKRITQPNDSDEERNFKKLETYQTRLMPYLENMSDEEIDTMMNEMEECFVRFNIWAYKDERKLTQSLSKQEQLARQIEQWEFHNDEDFFEYVSSYIDIAIFMWWAMGREYITQEQFNKWEEDILNKEDNAKWLPYIAYNCQGNSIGDIPYSIVKEDTYSFKGKEKAIMIFANFISESIIFKKRFDEFLENHK